MPKRIEISRFALSRERFYASLCPVRFDTRYRRMKHYLIETIKYEEPSDQYPAAVLVAGFDEADFGNDFDEVEEQIDILLRRILPSEAVVTSWGASPIEAPYGKSFPLPDHCVVTDAKIG